MSDAGVDILVGSQSLRPSDSASSHPMNTPTPDFSRRIPQLDGLRGVAIAMVVIFHYVTNSLGSAHSGLANVLVRSVSLCWSGVDLFFVLSGFLIGGILLDARGSSNYFRVFYLRRVCRIVPLYFAFLTIVVLGAHFSNWSLFHPVIPWQAEVTFCQNFWMAVHRAMGSYAMRPTWSLAIEEQFYLILPAVIYFLKPSRIPWFLGTGIILAPLVRLAIYLANPQSTTAIYVLLPCRMNALLLGVAVAYFVRQPWAWQFLSGHRREMRIGLVFLIAACSLFLTHSGITEPVEMFLGFDCFALLYTFFLVTSLVDNGLANALEAKWLMSLGGIAYCVYLIHHPIFALTVYALRGHGDSGLLAAIIALPLTIIIAKMSWKWFEKPFIRLGHRASYSGRREVRSTSKLANKESLAAQVSA